MATAGDNVFSKSDLDPITLRSLGAFRRRRSVLLVARALGAGLLVFITLALGLAVLDYLVLFGDSIRWACSIGIYAATAITMWFAGIADLRSSDALEIAKHVESAAPEMREELVSAVELSDPDQANGSPYFRGLLQNRVAKKIAKLDVASALPIRLISRWVFSGGTVALLCIALMFIPSAQFGRRLARAALPGIKIERASRTKVRIVQPEPPSGYVAQRDAVGVIVDVQGAAPDDVMLHWKSEDGTSGESLMTPRVRLDDSRSASSQPIVAPSESTPDFSRFAANLSVGSVPIEYRITAGDAVTLWHRLTPLPRPRVTRYEKRYRLPEYAKLSDRSADEEHGDLKALQGSTADVTVTFDQPVEQPIVQFGLNGARVPMDPVDDSDTRFLAKISIKTSGQYQVDARSIRSGLNNPFSPNNMINPVLDLPPIVRWDGEVEETALVSSLDVIDLAGTVRDDLPLERVTQEFQINNEPFQSLPLPIESPDRKLNLRWSWDLLHRLGDTSETEKLRSGDTLRTRLVAVDRKGVRAESELIEFLVAGDGFDAERNAFLQPLSKRVDRVMQWARQCQDLSNRLKQAVENRDFSGIDAEKEFWKKRQSDSVDLIKTVSSALTQTQNTASASMTELVGRGILDVETRLDAAIKKLDWLADHDDRRWDKERKRNLDGLKRKFEQAGYQAQRLSDFAQSRFALALTAAVYSDTLMLRDRVSGLVEDMPLQRLPRYVDLIAGQMAEIDRLIATYESRLTPQMIQHLGGYNWSDWSSRWALQLDTLMKDNARRDQIAAVIRSLQSELDNKPQNVVFSGSFNDALRWGRDLRNESSSLSDLTRRARDSGRRYQQSTSAAEKEKNPDRAFVHETSRQWHLLEWTAEVDRLVVRTAGQEKLNRAKQKVDLEYAADQNLFFRALKNVTESGYQPFKEESLDGVLDALSKAIGVLEAASDVDGARSDLLTIQSGERQHDASPLRKIYHPVWFKLQDTRIELGARYLRQSGVEWDPNLARIDAVRHNDDHTLAYSRLDSRLWRLDPFVSAARPLQSMADELQQGLTGISAEREQARQVLRRYVLSISQQARQAAESAERAQRETDQRTDANEESVEQTRPQQDDAVSKATETVQSLIDQANTADLLDDRRREIARDADAAAELVAEAVKETKQALKEVDSATSAQDRDQALESVEQKLQSLKEQLERTAEHFERIESGEDVSQSREDLRRDEERLRNDAIRQRYEQAEQMAETAKQDPRQLLEELEDELRQNPPMQEALSEIASEIVRDSAQALRQASDEEDSLSREIESDDKAFHEQKQQHRLLLDELAERAKTLRDRTLNTASQAAGWANEPAAQGQLEQVRGQLDAAIKRAEQAADKGDSSLNEIRDAAGEMKRQIDRVLDQTQRATGMLSDGAEKELHGNERNRSNVARTMQSNENRLKNEELRAIDAQRRKWNSAESSAGSRVRSAEQKMRQADTAINRTEAKLKKDPDNEWLQSEAKKNQSARAEAERAAAQARKTKEMARDRKNAATERANAINKSKAVPLEKPNPAAELGQTLAANATERMKRISQELEEFGERSDIADQLRSTADSAADLQNKQHSVGNDVAEVVNDLARASRHESRLENEPIAQRLAEASAQTEQTAGQAAEDAGESLRQAAEQGDRSAQAGRSLREARDVIGEQARTIASLLENDPPPATDQDGDNQPGSSADSAESMPGSSADASQSPTAPSGGQNSGQSSGRPDGQTPQTQSPQQMAQTLDELDRSLSSQPGSQPPGETSGQQPGEASADGRQAQGQQSQKGPGEEGSATQQPGGEGQPGSEGQAGKAIDASPTLAQMLEAQMQQAAKERMKSLQQAQASPSPGENSPSNASTDPNSESGNSDPPAGQEHVELLDGSLTGGDWGELRRRSVDDAAQGRGARIPPGYSQEIQAYFKALSKRAAESE